MTNKEIIERIKSRIGFYKEMESNSIKYIDHPDHQMFVSITAEQNRERLEKALWCLENIKELRHFLKNPPPTDELQDLQGPGDNT